MNDVRDQTEEQAWLAFLAEAGEVLSSSLDVDATLDRVAALSLVRLADWCLVELVDEAGHPSRLVVTHREPEKRELAREIKRRYPPDREAPRGAAAVLKSGKSALFRLISEEILTAAATDAEHLALLRQLSVRSVMVVPMFARGRGLGTITFGSSDGAKCFGERDLAMAEELARHAALAIDNARLYDAEREAREKITRIQRVTAELALALSSERIAEVTIDHGVDAVGARNGGLWMLQQGQLVLLRARGFPEAAVERFSLLRLDGPAPLAQAVRDQIPVFIESRAEYAARYAVSAERTEDLVAQSIQGVACLPLIAGERVLGGIALAFEGHREFADDERQFLMVLANHCALSLERAALYEAERRARAETALLYTLADATQRASSLEALYDAALDALSAALGTSRSAILLADEQGMMRFRAWRGVSEGHRRGIDGRTAWPRNQPEPPPILVSDAQADPVCAAWAELLAADGIRALVLVPLADRGGLVGKLAAYFESPRVLSSDEMRLTHAIASHVGEALARKLAEAEIARLLSQAQSARAVAELAADCRERMLAVVAHDLRNFLHVAEMRTSLLIRRVAERETSTLVRGDLDAIQRSTQGMSRLIDDLLDTAAIDAGRLSIEPKPCELRQLFADALDTARLLGEEREIVIFSEARASSCTLVCDRQRVLQVLANLVSNAVKFSPCGARVQLDCELDAKQVVFAVRDQGLGISDEQQARVFERYFKGDDGRPGVGLGLYISKALVEAHDGRLWIESNPGAGTQVFVALPLRARDALDHERAAGSRASAE